MNHQTLIPFTTARQTATAALDAALKDKRVASCAERAASDFGVAELNRATLEVRMRAARAVVEAERALDSARAAEAIVCDALLAGRAADNAIKIERAG